MAKKDNFPLKNTKFDGGAKLTQDTPDALAELLNDLAADVNLIQACDTPTLAVAGGTEPTFDLAGEDWSPNYEDYIVKIGKYDGAVASDGVAQTGGVTELTLDPIPALTDYAATDPIIVTILGKIGGRSGYIAAGSIQLAGV